MEDNNINKKENNKDNNNGQRPGNGNLPKKPRFNAVWIYALIGFTLILIYFFDSGQTPVQIDWKFFRNELLLKNEIEKIQVINERVAEIYIKEEYLDDQKHQQNFSKGLTTFTKAGPHYRMPIGGNEIFQTQLDEAQGDLPDEQKLYPEYVVKRTFGDTLYFILPLLVLVIIYIIIFRRMSGGGGGDAGNHTFKVGE